MPADHRQQTREEIVRFVQQDCLGNWRFAARTFIALSRVLLAGKFLSSRHGNNLDRDHLRQGYEHHRQRFEENTRPASPTVRLKNLDCALGCLSKLCTIDPSIAGAFYVSVEGDRILCREQKYQRQGEKALTVPLPKSVLRALLEPYCGAAFVHNTLAAELRTHYRLLGRKADVSHEICSLSEAFNELVAARGRNFDWVDLQSHLVVRTGIEDDDVREAFVEWLLEQRPLRQDRFSGALYRVGRADPTFLRNTMLGVYSGVPGFDYLFEGALYANEVNPLSIIIRGTAGSGKSSIAATLAAAAWADNGGLVHYAAMEQDAKSLQHLLWDWGLWHDNTFRVFSDESDADDVRSCAFKDLGAFVCGKPGYCLAFEDLTAKLHENFKKELWASFPLKLVVIDSVNTLRSYPAGDEDRWRADLSEFVESAKRCGYSVLLVLEEGSIGTHRVDCFVADTVINLSYRPYREPQGYVSRYDYRSFEIGKARQQHTCRGQHLFRLRSGRGIRLYPSSGAMFATLKKPERFGIGPRDFEVAQIRVAEKLVRNFSYLRKDREKEWLLRGTCTAIMGEGGTHKTQLARAFSKSAAYSSRFGWYSLLILFGQRFDCAEDEKAEELYGLTEHCRCYDVRPRASDDERNSSRELVLEFPSGYQEASQVVSEVVESIEYMKGRHYQLSSAVLDDLDSMEVEHPVLASDELFLPCMVQLLQSEGASVFLANRQPAGSFERHDRRIESLSQNVIRLVRVHEPGRDRIAIYVSKSATGRHADREMELTKDGDGVLRIKADSFRLYRDVREGGKLSRIEVSLIVPCDTELQENYYADLQEVHRAANTSLKIHILKPGPDLHRRSLSSQFVSSSQDVLVVACDNPDLPGLVEEGYLENLAELLSKPGVGNEDIIRQSFGENVDVGSLFSESGPFLPSIFRDLGEVKRGEQLLQCAQYQLPYGINPAVLACSNAFCQSVRSECPNYAWADLARLARKEAESRHEPTRLFECRSVSPQTYACWFLELFFSLLDELPPVSEGCFEICQVLKNEAKKGREALGIAYELGGPEAGNEQYRRLGSLEQRNGCPSVFARHWWSTFRQEVDARITHSSEPLELVAMPLPKYVSFRGDWHLCVASGSASSQVGAQFIVEMLSDGMTLERMAGGVSITPKRRFFDSDFALPISNIAMSEFQKIHERGIGRSRIRCYRSLSLLLGSCIVGLLKRPRNMATPDDFTTFLGSLRDIFSSVDCPVRRKNNGHVD